MPKRMPSLPTIIMKRASELADSWEDAQNQEREVEEEFLQSHSREIIKLLKALSRAHETTP